ncbi:MAG TPA: hypothetical protein VLY20_05310 [Nitrospiria bacterium]|nr:hypothetical protein [Nitrospiria bacterium]
MVKLIWIDSVWTSIRRPVLLFVMVFSWTIGDAFTPLHFAAAASPEWLSLGLPVKAHASTFTYVDATKHALNPSLVFADSVPWLGWNELDIHGISQVFVGRWNRFGWTLDQEGAQNIDGDHRAFDLTMGSDGKIPYLAWVELNAKNVPQLYVKHRSEGQWIVEGDSFNVDPTQGAANPTLSADGPIPYLAWCEYSPQRVFRLYVKQRSADGWHLDGNGSLNISPARDAIKPAMVSHGSFLYLTWAELSDRNFYQVYVKRWNGSSWDGLGPSLNTDPQRHALNPSIAVLGDSPYVAWIEQDGKGIFQLYVKRWDHGSWIVDGKNLNIDAARHAMSPSLIQSGSTVYLTWMEYDATGISQIHVKRRTGDRWESVDQRLNATPSTPSSVPSFASSDSAVYLAWKEVYSNGLAQIIVKHLASR